jgi:4-carboxymuconolactone decarboxylase
MSDDINTKTKETAAKFFAEGIRMDPPYLMWLEFDKDLANDFSRFITGVSSVFYASFNHCGIMK